MRALQDEGRGLTKLVPHLLPSQGDAMRTAPIDDSMKADDKLREFGIEVIELIQDVFNEYRLEDSVNRTNPANNGWLKVFRRWMLQDGFISAVVWPGVKVRYSQQFRQFIEQLQELPGRDYRTTMFQELTQKWYAPIVVSLDAATRLADSYSGLMRELREKDSGLEKLIPHLLPDYGRENEAPPIEAAMKTDVKLIVFGTEVIQLVENVFTEYQLEHPVNRANPRNTGWMKVFRCWMVSGGFLSEVVWPHVMDSYNPLFQKFVTQVQTEGEEDMPRRP
jgi:hypothetical protein